MDILELKRKYGKVFRVDVNGIEVLFRLPSWKDYKLYVDVLDREIVPRVYLYDSIYQDVVLNEPLVDNMYQLPAGFIDSIVELVLYIAGNALRTEWDVARVNEDIDVMRGVISTNIYDQFVMLICHAFPSYTPSAVDELDWHEVLRLLLMAENILMREGKIQQGVNILPADEQPQPESLASQIMKDTQMAQRSDLAPPPFQQGLSPEQQKQAQMMDNVHRRRMQQG